MEPILSGENSNLDESELIGSTLKFLKDYMSKEANICINKCLEKNNTSGIAWLIKLCVECEEYELYEYLLDEKAEVTEQYFETFSINTMANCVKYVSSDLIKKKLISMTADCFYYKTDDNVLKNEDLNYLEEVYEFLRNYDDESLKLIESIKSITCENVIHYFCGEKEDLYRFLDKMLVSSNTEEVYKETLIAFVDSFLQFGDFISAEKYNEILLKKDENSADGYVNNCLIETKSRSLWEYGRKTSVELDTELIKDKIAHSDKESAEKLIELFTSREEALFEFGIYDEARELFDLIMLYEFRNKQDFLIQNAKIFSRGVLEVDITEGELDDFIEEILSQITDKTKKCECINNIAEAYLKVENFDAAYDYAMKSLECESDYNHKARWILLLVELKCTDDNEFVHNSDFSKDMENYKELVLATRKDEDAIKRYSRLIDKNIKIRTKLAKNSINHKTLKNLEEKLNKYVLTMKILNIIGLALLSIFIVISILSVYFYFNYKVIMFCGLIPMAFFGLAFILSKNAEKIESKIDESDNKK